MHRVAVPLVTSLVVLVSCSKTAPAPAPVLDATPVAVSPPRADCAAVPAAVAGHAVVELDLDGQAPRERLVPTACDGDGTCTWAVA